MEQESGLYRWIRARELEGTVESRGSFTLAQEKAWEKLGAFQLPFPFAWILKVVQAAVVAGAQEIQVVQTRTETQFRLVGELGWTWASLGHAIFEQENEAPPGLRDLAVGLRALARSTARPFSLQFPDQPTVTWDGKTFEVGRESSPSRWAFVLAASHFAIGESQALLSLDNLDAHSVSAQILKTLTESAYVCPIPLSVDGRRITGVEMSPRFQPSETCRPVALLVAPPEPGLPGFRVCYQRGWQQAKAESYEVALKGDLSPFEEPEDEVAVMALVCAFLENDVRGTTAYWGTRKELSRICWVRDGVVVETEDLSLFSPVALSVLLSAEGMRTDLSGLALSQQPEKGERRRRALLRVLEDLKRLQGTFEVSGEATLVSLMGGWKGLFLSLLDFSTGVKLLFHAGLRVYRGQEGRSDLAAGFQGGLAEVIRGLEKWQR